MSDSWAGLVVLTNAVLAVPRAVRPAAPQAAPADKAPRGILLDALAVLERSAEAGDGDELAVLPLGHVFAGQNVRVTQVGERIWLVTFMQA